MKKVVIQRFEIELSSEKGKIADTDAVLESLDELKIREEVETFVRSLLMRRSATVGLNVVVTE
jgi:hypothetical protein